MAKGSSKISEPLFQGLDFDKMQEVETVSEDKVEKYSFGTVDFNDPLRPKTCLEIDFPILKVNEISAIESNATKPIYMMSKWWARRRSSVFRELLIAASTKAPEDPARSAQTAWALMYSKSHQKKATFKDLKVLDIFMGGGTTVVEASRLGFDVAGVDLNPIAWWIVKNEIETVPPEQLRKFSDYIELKVKPQILPFFTATSPRGYSSTWKTSDRESPSSIAVKPE